MVRMEGFKSTGMASYKKREMCSVFCTHFKCAQKALNVQKNHKTGKKKIYCKFADDLCIGYQCKYAVCAIHKLRSEGVCARSLPKYPPIHESLIEEHEDESVELLEKPPKKITRVLKNKVLKKLKNVDFV